MAKSGLGTGLGALIGSPEKRAEGTAKSPFAPSPRSRSAEESTSGDAVVEVEITRILASTLQPRKHFREDQLQELVDSIKEHGIIQPLIVRPADDDQLELIAGERRWRACQRIGGLTKVPVIIREASDKDVLEMALIENIQRADLDPVEEAEAYVRLSKDFGMRQEDIAKRVGKNRATVANAMRLLELDPEVQTHLAQGRLSVGHAKVLLGLKEGAAQKSAADMVVKQGFTVRATERLLQQMQNPEKAPAKVKKSSPSQAEAALSPALLHIQNCLRDHLATSVKLTPGEKKGKVEVEYYGDEDLERLLEVMGVKLGDL
jgi:ParB family transcriptional regulator, chromosome partitioning protein